jgi:hypothetical protein
MPGAAPDGSVGRMATKLRRTWQLSRVREGDGSALPPYRLWQLFSRSLLHLGPRPEDPHRYSLDVRVTADPKSRKEHEAGTGKSPAALYRDGVQVHRSNLPATFPVPGGVIEVATSMAGVKRARFLGDDGTEQALEPDPRSQEGRRARLAVRRPAVSAALGAASFVVLLAALALALLQGAETLTAVPPVAERLGAFDSPVDLPAWGNGVVLGAALLAALERASRMRYHWLLDSVAS